MKKAGVVLFEPFEDRPSIVLVYRQYALCVLAILLSWFVARHLAPAIGFCLEQSKLLILLDSKTIPAAAGDAIADWALGLACLATLFDSGRFHLRRQFLRYTVNETEIVITEGILERRAHRVPMKQVTQVELHQTPLGRLANYGDVTVKAAGGSLALLNLPDARRRTESLMSRLR